MIRLITFTAAMTCVFMPTADPMMAVFWMLTTIFLQLWKNGRSACDDE